MTQKKMSDWISPLEASLEMSLRQGCYISPDDIKQARKRLPQGAHMPISNRLSVYSRNAIRQAKINKVPSKQKQPDLSVVISWLWEFPETIRHLEREGFVLPLKREAEIELEKQRNIKQSN